MKTIFLLSLAFGLSFSSFSQNQSCEELPPIEILSQKGKIVEVYKLPAEIYFKVYNQRGKLKLEGKGKWIDFTKFKKGTYFIKYDDQIISYLKE